MTFLDILMVILSVFFPFSVYWPLFFSPSYFPYIPLSNYFYPGTLFFSIVLSQLSFYFPDISSSMRLYTHIWSYDVGSHRWDANAILGMGCLTKNDFFLIPSTCLQISWYYFPYVLTAFCQLTVLDCFPLLALLDRIATNMAGQALVE